MTDIVWPEMSDRALMRCKLMLRILAEAAAKDERCPTLDGFMHLGLSAVQATTQQLLKAGIIRIEVAGHNWRTVWICQGPHTGRHTKLSPSKSKPYMVFGPARPRALVARDGADQATA